MPSVKTPTPATWGPEDVRARVADIQASAGDPEVAHIMQDKLWADVLGAIAQGAEDAAGLAEAALQVEAVAFPRWYA